jgi:aspartyl-tRNA(Asn)/glutamyl-tRNA(Gln) amidotransferase subunit C
MPSLSRGDVAHLARLSRLALTDSELDEYGSQLGVILAAVERVSEVAAEDVPPTTHAVPVVNVFRSDTIRPCLTAAEVLSGAPAAEDDKFRVPRILGED